MKSLVSSEIVQPYAQALMSVGKSQNLTERFGEEVRSLLSALEASPELSDFLANPFVKSGDKKAVLESILGPEVHPFLRNFLMLLVDKGRIMFLEGICKQYLTLLRDLNQTVLAEVTSAVELNEAQQQSVKEKVQTMTGSRSVELQTSIDPDLIGGVIIKVGSQIIDASLRGQLRRIGVKLAA